VHGLVKTYPHNVQLYTASLGKALSDRGISVDYRSGFFLPSVETAEVDLTVFSFDLLSQRNGVHWPAIHDSIRAWSRFSPRKVALVQDDFSSPRLTEQLVLEGTVDCIFSPHAFDGRSHVLYPSLSSSQTRYVRNGYLEPTVLEVFDRIKAKKHPFERQKVFGRVRQIGANFGELGPRKSRILERLEPELRLRGVPTDITSAAGKRVYGYDWYHKVAMARAVVNPVGGADFINKKGWIPPLEPDSFAGQSFLFLRRLLRGRNLNQPALPNYGPRVLEALALGTPQVLSYHPDLIEKLFPGLRAWKHFLPLEGDLSNISEVSDCLADESALSAIAGAGREYARGEPSFYFSSLAEKVLSELPTQQQSSPTREKYIVDEKESLFSLASKDIRELQSQVTLDLRRMAGKNRQQQFEHLDDLWGGEEAARNALNWEIVRLYHAGQVTPFAVQAMHLLQENRVLRSGNLSHFMGIAEN